MDLCLVSMGAADGYYELTSHCWDLAAGLSVVSDAGGVVIPAGGEFEVMAQVCWPLPLLMWAAR